MAVMGPYSKCRSKDILRRSCPSRAQTARNPAGALTADGQLVIFTKHDFRRHGVNEMGTIFRMNGAGAWTNLLSFSELERRVSASAGLTLGTDGNFYGSTVGGGADASINGTFFRMTANGVLTTLVSLGNTNGATPYDAPIVGLDGNYYGTTTAGGVSNNNFGTIFEMTASGRLANFVFPSATRFRMRPWCWEMTAITTAPRIRRRGVALGCHLPHHHSACAGDPILCVARQHHDHHLERRRRPEISDAILQHHHSHLVAQSRRGCYRDQRLGHSGGQQCNGPRTHLSRGVAAVGVFFKAASRRSV